LHDGKGFPPRLKYVVGGRILMLALSLSEVGAADRAPEPVVPDSFKNGTAIGQQLVEFGGGSDCLQHLSEPM